MKNALAAIDLAILGETVICLIENISQILICHLYYFKTNSYILSCEINETSYKIKIKEEIGYKYKTNHTK